MTNTSAELQIASLQPAARTSLSVKLLFCAPILILASLWLACSSTDAKPADARKRGGQAIPVTVATRYG